MVKQRCEDCKQMRSTVDLRISDYRLCDECNNIRHPTHNMPRSNDDEESNTCPKILMSNNNAISDMENAVYHNELLSYVLYYYQNSSVDMIRKTVLAFYTSEEISAAKDLFWETNDNISIPKQRRISTSVRAAHEADFADIIGAISELDTKGCLNIGKYYAINLGRIPKFTPEEMNTLAVIDRLRALELQLSEVKDMTMNHSTRIDSTENQMSLLTADLYHPRIQTHLCAFKNNCHHCGFINVLLVNTE